MLSKLKNSKFRSSFYLDEKDKSYIQEKGINKIKKHAEDFLIKRIKFCRKNDGKQTPWKGHPVFKAQHATATCCRKCIEKWYKIPKNKVLNDNELYYIHRIIMAWIFEQTNK